MNTGRRLAIGTFVMSAGNLIKAVLQLLLLPVMARLLGPTEFGIYALAMPVIQFMLMLADGGLGQSLAREPEDNWRIWSSAFWLLLAASVGLALMVVGSSFVMAALTAQPRLPPIMAALSACLIIFVVAVPSNARLLRQGRMEVGPIGDILATAAGAGIAIVLAVRGFGAWSLVGQTLVMFLIRTIVAVVAAPVVPRLHLSFHGLRDHLAMGGSVVGIKLVDTGDRMIENSVIGRSFGSATLGSFSFAIQITRFACESLSNALWAALYIRSVHAQSAEQRYLDYLRVFRIIAVLLFPAACIGAGAARNVIVLLLGAKWAGAVPLVEFYLPSYAICVAGTLGSAVLYAGGRTAIQFRINVEAAVLRIAGVVAVTWIGMTAFAAWIAAANLYTFVRSVGATCKYLGTAPRSIYATGWRPLACAAAAGVFCRIATGYAKADIVSTAVIVAIGGAIYLVLLAVADRTAFRNDCAQIMQFVAKRAHHT
jgi:O-antigen/teichoic acid export membrane protein